MDSDRTYYEIEESSNDAQNCSPDDRAIYRALARQILGDPQNFKYILNEVLHHYLQTWFNQKRALHQTYRQYDKPVANFHSYLSKPGLSNSPLILQRVLTVALNALRTEIIIRESSGTNPIGHAHGNHMQCWISVKKGQNKTTCSSLILEDTGEDLIKYMANFKAHKDSKQLNIKEVKWWWDPADPFNKFTRANEFESLAEFNPDWPSPTIGQPLPGIVKTPDQIQPALNLLFNILPPIPGQKIPVNGSRSFMTALKGRLLPYVGIDSEFKLVSDSLSDEALEADNICTVLSIAVDRHATFCFYILDMLEKARKDTVSGLWIRVIFNKKLLKIRFNFQSDISTLDNTIGIWVNPKFKLSDLFPKAKAA
ncbi:uncharacterized protein IWZ02DRAFT_430714 [Phyllosticta citriasiana]|uniref:uncharacterized protein n=1 Tax=Phyllosticta citriasiana TaxID=595635 RepID=UPI0030FD4256